MQTPPAEDSESETAKYIPINALKSESSMITTEERFNGSKWASLSRPNITIYEGSDVLFSVRKGRCLYSTDPLKRDDLCIPEIEKFISSFEPNRLVWHYPFRNLTSATSSSNPLPSLILPKFKRVDPAPQCSINVFADTSDPTDIHCRDLNGNTVKSDWETWEGISRPDVLKDKFIELQKKHVQKLVESGCKVLQQDSVSLNYETFSWGGCFSSEGDRKFRTFLSERFDSEELNKLSDVANMNAASSDFSISEYFKENGALEIKLNKKGEIDLVKWMESYPQSTLLHLYREFSNYKSLEYLQLMKVTAKKASGGTYVPLSGNVAFYDANFPLYQVLDFMTAEWVDERQTIHGFLEMAMFAERMGKSLVGTPATDNVNLHRSMFATAYALGNHMILPYDVYIDSSLPRYHVDVAKFKDLTVFTKANAELLDDTHTIETFGSMPEPITAVERFCSKSGSICDSQWDRILVKHGRMSEFKKISRGSKVIINGLEYVTTADSENGSIYLDGSNWKKFSSFKAERPSIEMIESNGKKHDLVRSLESKNMPTLNTPRVQSIEYGITKPGFTTIRTNMTDVEFPKGTEFKFAATNYKHETDGATRVGQIYFKDNLIDKVFPGQAISYMQKPGESRIFFETSSSPSSLLKLPANEHNLLVSVRKKKIEGKTKSIVHLINWKQQFDGDSRKLRSTNLDIDFERMFGFKLSSKTSCKFVQAGSTGSEEIKPVQVASNSGRFTFNIKNLWTWGILTCSASK